MVAVAVEAPEAPSTAYAACFGASIDAERMSCENFLDNRYDEEGAVNYLVSIQAFQHGDARTAKMYSERTAAVLQPNGLLFLRVNSAGTDIYHPHEIVERNGYGGFTVAYSAGPKKGLRVHFFARRELESVLRRVGLDLLGAPVKRTVRRRPPETGEWRQWELTVVRRTRRAAAVLKKTKAC